MREDRIAYNQGQRLVACLNHIPTTSPQTTQESVSLKVGQTGNLDSLSLQSIQRRQPGPGEVEILVLAVGLNFRDVLKALGRYPGENGTDVSLGDECSGLISAVGSGVESLRVGDPVIALASGAFASFVTTSADLVLPRPPTISPEEAASIPIPFLTAWYTLYHLAHLSSGQRVLIHSAAGGVGMAAVQLAQRTGAEIFATAGSHEKRDFLRSLGVQHVMDSRTLEFSGEISHLTAGHGVDVVLNSLAGEFISKNLSVLAPNGCFLEIGKTGILTTEEAARIRPDIAYHPVFLGEMFAKDPELIRKMLGEILTAIQSGELSPLPRREFSILTASGAFRWMARAQHIGKIVLTLPALNEERLFSKTPLFKPDATYLVTGGLGGIGQILTRWMVDNGARNLAIISRQGRSHPQAQQLVQNLNASGAQVSIFKANMASMEELIPVFDEIQAKLPILRGVIHTAGIVEDGVILQQDWKRFQQVLAGKAAGAWNLSLVDTALVIRYLRPVLFNRCTAWIFRTSQLRRRECLPRCPGFGSEGRRLACNLYRLGCLVRNWNDSSAGSARPGKPCPTWFEGDDSRRGYASTRSCFTVFPCGDTGFTDRLVGISRRIQ